MRENVLFPRLFCPSWLAVRVFNIPVVHHLFVTPRATRWIRSRVYGLWIAERLPWFVRKRLVNLIAGREVFYDFFQSDHVISGDGLRCFKW